MYFLKRNEKYKFAKPVLNKDGEVDLLIKHSEYLIVSCHATNLILRTSRVEENYSAFCNDDRLETSSSDVQLGEYQCTENVDFQKKNLEETCAGPLSESYEIGIDVLFRQHSSKIPVIPQKLLDFVKWYPLYSVCFNDSVKETIYTRHIINGASIKARQTGISKSSDNKYEFGSEFRIRKHEKINPDDAFKLDDQQQGMIEDPSFVPYFNHEKKNLMKKTLVPPEDMLYFGWQQASYFYLNIAPMWSNLECTWKNLEKHIRIAAARYETELIVYTGVYEKFRINDQEVTLDKHIRAITVPFYFWKIVYHRVNRSGIAFVMNNDPYKRNPRLCIPKDKSVGRTWPIYNDAYRLGLLYPCLVDDLRKAINLPEESLKFIITQELYYPTN
ncbi:uncharacterized protein LOC135840540 isoform X2 [Planococcus citri]